MGTQGICWQVRRMGWFSVVDTQQVSLEGWHNLSRCREALDTHTKIASEA